MSKEPVDVELICFRGMSTRGLRMALESIATFRASPTPHHGKTKGEPCATTDAQFEDTVSKIKAELKSRES